MDAPNPTRTPKLKSEEQEIVDLSRRMREKARA